jgi:hypothetical protein
MWHRGNIAALGYDHVFAEKMEILEFTWHDSKIQKILGY